ncbi:MAG: phosphoribosylformylglycinamidine synthase subunit PurS [Bacteroidota bacterium]
MKYIAEIDVMPLKELLDPQGKTVANNLKHIDLTGVEDVRIGKHIKMTLEAADEAEAKAKVEMACKKLLSNPVMESYTFSLQAAS